MYDIHCIIQWKIQKTKRSNECNLVAKHIIYNDSTLIHSICVLSHTKEREYTKYVAYIRKLTKI